MKKILATLAAGGLVAAAGMNIAVAQDDDDGLSAVPVEIYACNFRDGKGPGDVGAVSDKWNDWADNAGLTEYTAWTLLPIYFSPEQEFDILWLGVSPNATSLGRDQDKWLATGGKMQAEFDKIMPCTGHSNFASIQFKAPPQSDNPPDNVYISFSDCNMADGVSFGDDVAPALTEWAAYRSEHGSQSGMWVLFPVYGGGGEEFDFKYLTGHRTLEDQGADWDQYSEAGRHKARELFDGKLDCDSSRVYHATNRRRAEASE